MDWIAVLMVEEIISAAQKKGIYLALAESITAGMICARLAEVPGASKVLLGGINAYQDQIKSQTLGVSPALLQMQSAVDPEVAAQLAEGVRAKFAIAMQLSPQQVIGLSATGVAGPDSVGPHPPGEVYLAISSNSGTKVFAEQFSGSRADIRLASLERALAVLREEIANF
jgi:PncC family amidohydrolase